MIFHLFEGNVIYTCGSCVFCNWTTTRINASLQRKRREERRAMNGIKGKISAKKNPC